MGIRLKIASERHLDGEASEVSAQIDLPTRGLTFTMSPRGARQLGEHLLRLADMIESEAA